MTEAEYKPWPVSRLNRLMQILEHKARGLNNKETAEKMGLAVNTISRELNSPQAYELGRRMAAQTTNLISSLVDRQISQIETGGIKPISQVIARGRLINTMASLLPKQVEQKISGELTQEVKLPDVSEEDHLIVGWPVTLELIRRAAQGIDAAVPEENPEEPVD